MHENDAVFKENETRKLCLIYKMKCLAGKWYKVQTSVTVELLPAVWLFHEALNGSQSSRHQQSATMDLPACHAQRSRQFQCLHKSITGELKNCLKSELHQNISSQELQSRDIDDLVRGDPT
jgi:hypothetical protein